MVTLDDKQPLDVSHGPHLVNHDSGGSQGRPFFFSARMPHKHHHYVAWGHALSACRLIIL